MSINIQEALTSKSYAYRCYYDYNNGNKMGISAEDYGKIIGKWGNSTVLEWQKNMSKDENNYELTDERFDASEEKGKKKAENAAGYDGKTGGQIGAAIGHGIGGLGTGLIGSTNLGSKIGAKLNDINKGNNIFSKTTNKMNGGNKEGAINAGKDRSAGDIVTVVLALATAVTWWAKQPNKEAVEALNVLNNEELPAAQAASQEAQAEMEEAAEKTQELAEEAQDKNDEGNENIAKEKTLNDTYKAEYEMLKAKENPTPEEKSRMNKLANLMNEKSDNVKSIEEDTSEEVGDLHEEIGEYQESYDEAGETIAEVNGVTEYAEGFDTTTKWTSMAEMIGQGLNALGAGIAAGRLLASGIFNWVNLAFGAMGLTAVGLSTGAVVKETQNMKVAGTEIKTREMTQELNAETSDIYDEEIDVYEGTMEDVENMTLEIPDEIGAPEETSETPLSMAANDTKTDNTTNDDKNDKDKDKDKDKVDK